MSLRSCTALAALVVVLCFTPAAHAQQWSAEQQEVIDTLKECWDIWMEDVRGGVGPDGWLEQCAVPDYSYWWIFGVPHGAEEDRRNWETISETDLGWISLQPVAVRIYDDVAVMHFYGTWRVSNSEEPLEAKRTEIFQRVDGRWKMIAGHATPIGK